MIKGVQQMWVTLIYCSSEVTPSPEDLPGCCSISALQSQTVLSLVAVALIFLLSLSSFIQV